MVDSLGTTSALGPLTAIENGQGQIRSSRDSAGDSFEKVSINHIIIPLSS